MIHAEFVDQVIDMFGGDAGPDFIGQHVEAFGREPAGFAHAFEGRGAVDLDLSGFTQRRDGRVDIGHGVAALGDKKRPKRR